MSWDLSRTSAPSNSCVVSERPCSAGLLAEIAGQVLDTGTRVRFTARGGSMYPCIQDGDMVEVVPVVPEHVRPGDIVFCHPHHARPVVHRVVDVIRDTAGTRFVLRGDNETEGMEIASPSSVIGQVVALERQGRRHALTGLWGWLWSQHAFRIFMRWWLRARRYLGRLQDMATSRLRP